MTESRESASQARSRRRRRGLGIAVLVFVPLVSAVLPRISARPIAGDGSAAPAASAPSVGQCLAQNPDSGARIDVRGVDGLASPVIGPCERPHFGEMVSVFVHGSEFPHSVVNRLRSVDVSFCYQAADIYLGLSQRTLGGNPGQPDVGFSVWYPSERGQVALVGPTARQQQVGQDWVGCAIYSRAGSYVSTVRRAYAGGLLPDGFASCRNDIGQTANTSCADPHRVEIFGTASLRGSQINQQSLTSTCTSMVAAVTRMADTGAGGRLSVAATLFHPDASGPTQPGAPPTQGAAVLASAVCTISLNGPGALHGTLFGLGTRPLPLS